MTEAERAFLHAKVDGIRFRVAAVCNGRGNGCDLMVALLDLVTLEDVLANPDDGGLAEECCRPSSN